MMNVNEHPADQEDNVGSVARDESEVEVAPHAAPRNDATRQSPLGPAPQSANIGHNS
jgi:hypothetical protein